MSTICDTCHGGCCRAFVLHITAYDAFLISRDLGLPMGEFISLLGVNPDKYPDSIAFSDPGMQDQRFLLTLRRVESTLMPTTMKCIFLQEWPRVQTVQGRGNHPGAHITGRCGIYGSRPLMCRTYPTSLDGDGTLAYVAAQTNNDAKHQAYTLCPEPWSPVVFSKEPSVALHTLVLSEYENKFAKQAVAQWNLNPGPVAEFLSFMTTAYENRFRLGA